MKRLLSFGFFATLASLVSATAAFAESAATGASPSYVPIGAGIAMGVAALGGTLGQGKAISAALDSIGRNPSAAGQLQTPMIVGLVFVESLVILSFAIAYLILGK